jgi:death-on-curing protein
VRIPTLAEVIQLHADVLERGEAHGILNVGAIESALFRCAHGPFFGPVDAFDRAALLLRGLCQDHPFADGNKRTAFTATATWLEWNGLPVDAGADAIVDLMLAVAQDQLDLTSIAEWFRRHARQD